MKYCNNWREYRWKILQGVQRMLQPYQFANKGSHANGGIWQRKNRLRNKIFKHFKLFPWKGSLHLVGGTSHLPVWSVQTHFLWVMRGSFKSEGSHCVWGRAYNMTAFMSEGRAAVSQDPELPTFLRAAKQPEFLRGVCCRPLLALSPVWPWCLCFTASSHWKPVPCVSVQALFAELPASPEKRLWCWQAAILRWIASRTWP